MLLATSSQAQVFYQEDFASDNGGFTVLLGGEWQWGNPTVWPDGCQSGSNCWGTNLSGNYSNNANAVLASPVIDLSDASGPLEVVWWQALHMEGSVWDPAFAEIRIGDGPWEQMWAHSSGQDTVQTGWTERLHPLPFGTNRESVQLRFRIASDSSINFSGYYIDDIVIRRGPEVSVAISLAVNDPAQGGVEGPAAAIVGEEATVTATPNAGYRFVNWTEDGLEVSTDPAYTFLVVAPRALVANFDLAPVNGTCGVSHGDTFTSAPTTNLCSAGTAGSVTGSGPWNWTCNGLYGGSSASCSASVQTYAVTASASPATGGTASCTPNPIVHGGNTICTAVADTGSGFVFQQWTGACAGQGAACALNNVQADQTSTVVFGYQITVPEGPQIGQPVDLTPPTENTWQITTASSATTDSIGTPPPANVSLPYGVVNLRLEMGMAGSSATVVLTYPEALPAGTLYYKFGRTHANPTPHWYEFSGAVINGNTITLTLTDGGEGDDDLTANGVIVDPGGPAVAAGGVAAIPTLSEWAMLLLAGMIGLLAFGRLNPRRNPA